MEIKENTCFLTKKKGKNIFRFEKIIDFQNYVITTRVHNHEKENHWAGSNRIVRTVDEEVFNKAQELFDNDDQEGLQKLFNNYREDIVEYLNKRSDSNE